MRLEAGVATAARAHAWQRARSPLAARLRPGAAPAARSAGRHRLRGARPRRPARLKGHRRIYLPTIASPGSACLAQASPPADAGATGRAAVPGRGGAGRPSRACHGAGGGLAPHFGSLLLPKNDGDRRGAGVGGGCSCHPGARPDGHRRGAVPRRGQPGGRRGPAAHRARFRCDAVPARAGDTGHQRAARAGGDLGSELHAAGVNLNLAPVMDVVPEATAASNAPIGALDREFGFDPQANGEHGIAYVQGMALGGVEVCGQALPRARPGDREHRLHLRRGGRRHHRGSTCTSTPSVL